MTRVLVVEDEPDMARTLSLGLAAHGFAVEQAATGGLGLALVAASTPDLVILDLGLPDLDGVDVIEGIRGWNPVPMIVVSARCEELQKVRALDAGADDYVTKPFGLGELVARVRAILRAVGAGRDADGGLVFASAELSLDFDAGLARRGGEAVRLTPIEWALARALVSFPGRVVTYRSLLHDVWGLDEPDKNHYVRIHMAGLRRKLEPDPAAPTFFVTERGVGFAFSPGRRD